MSDETKAEIILLDDEQGVIKTAADSFPENSHWTLRTELLTRVRGATQLQEAIGCLEKNADSLLLLDWVPVQRDDDMRQHLTALGREGSPSFERIILTSWQPPGAFTESVKAHGLERLRRLHKPLRWEDVLQAKTANRDPSSIAKKAITPPRRRRLIHTGEGRYRVHPADMNKAAFWPLPQFDEIEVAALMNGHEVVKLHRGWLPWSRPNTAMGWYQVVTVARRWQESKDFPESLWQYGIECPKSWQPPTPDDAVENLFKLMAEVGFHRGRYYEIDQLPEEETRILQLTRANHPVYFEEKWQPSDEVLPIAKTLTGGLLSRAEEFIKRYDSLLLLKKKNLVYEARESCGWTEEGHRNLDTQFWNTLVGTTALSARLEIPVYRKQPPQSARQPKGLESLLGWMVFDRLPNPANPSSPDQVYATASNDLGQEKAQIVERVNIVEKLVLQAIEQVGEERAQRQNRHSEQQSQQLKNLRQLLGAADSREGREKALIDFAMKAGELDSTGKNSSVVFARYDAASKSLTVAVDTTGKLLNQQFPLSANFALAKCARSKKLRIVPNWHDFPEHEKIELADWQNLPAMDDQRANDLFQWARDEILTTVALPVLSKGDTLLGVLLEQHKRPYHFSRERIDNLQALVDTALPYLELDAARASADTWDGAVMHEIRSGIQKPYQSLNTLLRDQSLSEALRQEIQSTLYDIEDLRDLSNAFLERIGNTDGRTRMFTYGAETGGDWFAKLDAYGRHRAAAWAGFKEWQVFFPPKRLAPGAVPAAEKLIRVARILIDNAFRYGEIGTPVQLAVNHGSKTVEFKVSSGGGFSDSIRQGNFRNASERLDLGGRALRTHLGLSLANELIEEQGQQLRLENDEANHLAVAGFSWPLALATPETVDDEHRGE